MAFAQKSIFRWNLKSFQINLVNRFWLKERTFWTEITLSPWFWEKGFFSSLPVNVFFQWCAKASNSIVQKKFIFSNEKTSHLLCVRSGTDSMELVKIVTLVILLNHAFITRSDFIRLENLKNTTFIYNLTVIKEWDDYLLVTFHHY